MIVLIRGAKVIVLGVVVASARGDGGPQRAGAGVVGARHEEGRRQPTALQALHDPAEGGTIVARVAPSGRTSVETG